MDVERVVQKLMKMGFVIRRHRDGRIEAELRDEKFLIDPIGKSWMYLRCEGDSVFMRAFLSIDDLEEKIESIRESKDTFYLARSAEAPSLDVS